MSCQEIQNQIQKIQIAKKSYSGTGCSACIKSVCVCVCVCESKSDACGVDKLIFQKCEMQKSLTLEPAVLHLLEPVLIDEFCLSHVYR